MCHAPTDDTDSNNCWYFNDDDPISECNNMINNNSVGPNPLYNNGGRLFEDVNISEYTCPCHTSISDTASNTQLIMASSGLRKGVRKVMKGNSNSNSIHYICDHSDCPNKANVNNSNKSDNTFNERTIDLNNDGPSDDIFTASITTTTTTTSTEITIIIIMIIIL